MSNMAAAVMRCQRPWPCHTVSEEHNEPPVFDGIHTAIAPANITSAHTSGAQQMLMGYTAQQAGFIEPRVGLGDRASLRRIVDIRTARATLFRR